MKLKAVWNGLPKPLRKLIQYALVLAFWVGLWGIAALKVGESLLLPTPWEVIARLGKLCTQASFWGIVLTSLWRILWGILIAVAAGVILAVITHFVPPLYTLFFPVITVIRSTPVASFIILAYLWMSRDTLPAFIAILMVLPVVWANLHEALGATDKQLLEMAKVYGFSPFKMLRQVYLPSVLPAFLASCRSSVGLAWKAGVAAEVLLVPAVSIGRMLSDAKQNLETTDLFAWTLAVVLLSLCFELLLMGLVKLTLAKKSRQQPTKKEVVSA